MLSRRNHEKTNIQQFHLEEVTREVKFIDTESRAGHGSIQEAEAEGSPCVQRQPKLHGKTLSQKNKKERKKKRESRLVLARGKLLFNGYRAESYNLKWLKWGWGLSSVAQVLTGKCEVVSSIPRFTNK